VFVHANRGVLWWARAIAAVALAPALFVLVREVLFATDAVTSVFTLAAPAVALVICSLALLCGTFGPDLFARRDRIALEVGAAIVLVPAVFTAVVTFRSLGWLVIVFALWRPWAPLGKITAWSVLALAASSGVVDPFELVTVPVALALIGSGWLRLQGDPRARSWPWFGPGLLVLLVPSLLLDLTYNDLWRIVSLGVVATIVVVIGSTRRLQAPFVIDAVVLLIHGVAQLWSWIALAYSVVPWFLWLGGNGILLIVLAARCTLHATSSASQISSRSRCASVRCGSSTENGRELPANVLVAISSSCSSGHTGAQAD
jgi:hypothetical protein